MSRGLALLLCVAACGDDAVAQDASAVDSAPGDASADAGQACNVVDVNGNGPDDDDIQAVLCSGGDAVLCPDTVYVVDGLAAGGCAPDLRFTRANQQIYTAGQPTDATRAQLRITGAAISTAITGPNLDGIRLHHVIVDGNRPQLGFQTGGGALIDLTGVGIEVAYCDLHDPRAWSTLHLFEGPNLRCSGALIHHNRLGPAGCDKQGHGCIAGDPGGSWADGLSLACRAAEVHDNTIVDATDGAIVIFGSPGSHVYANHIVAMNRHLFGGINMVDPGPYSYDDGTHHGGDYTGTEVSGNDLTAAGARIDVGVAQGPRTWSSWCGQDLYNRGASVHDNRVAGPLFGYGFVADGVLNWSEARNSSMATHALAGAGCGGEPPPPSAEVFQIHAAHAIGSTLQGIDITGGIHNALQ